MNDLLSVSARRRIPAVYGEHISPKDANLIFWLFHYGSGFRYGDLHPRSKFTGERWWDDVEQFLEILDNAHADKTSAAAVERVFDEVSGINVGSLPGEVFPDNPKSKLRQLAAMARRMVAASCCTFLEGVNRINASTKERWKPYQQWLRWLHKQDTILTFNYDRVVELLGGQTAEGSTTTGVRVRGPERDTQDTDGQPDWPSLYKLHGSVDWTIDQHSNKVSQAPWTHEILGDSHNLAIATPGDSKMEMANGIFQRLWEEAPDALRNADDVFIIGFRFPPGDAYPRDKLLGALSQNEKKSLNVHIILGPEANADRARVIALLEWTVGVPARAYDPVLKEAKVPADTPKLWYHNLWAEDFLSAWSQKQLNTDGH